MDRVQAILREYHERDARRTQPDTLRQCTEALSGLESDSAEKRTAAATTLGELRYLHTYEPLLNALARECQPPSGERMEDAATGESKPVFGNRAVKAAILKALDNIGNDHAGQRALAAGREPLKEFSMAHLDDAGLVRAALKASAWTVSIMGDAIHDLDEVKEAARSAAAKDGSDAEKYRATEGAAVNLYFDWIRSR
jgi:hypothetical protein